MQSRVSTPSGGTGVGAVGAVSKTLNDLMPEVYDQLRALAAGYLRRDTAEPMLEPAVLVNEAYLRLAGSPSGKWQSKEHFLAWAALAMRKVLIDHARRRQTLKRGFGRSRVSLELVTKSGPREIDILEVDDALKALAGFNERASCAVTLRFFAGLTHDEIARVQGVSRKTVVNDWGQARTWLAEELAEKPAPPSEPRT
ncbi:MAG: ECF-type sigma factor [Planctomycetota bacterium]|jgi:RNA polymerase sigma factor (TIGR02999 family)